MIKEAKKIRKLATRKWLQDLKESLPCADCGKFYRYYVMQWDHLGDKSFNIAEWFAKDISRSKIEAELTKCELVCANCHAERTHQRRPV